MTKEVVDGSFHAFLCPKCGAECLKEKGQGYGRPFSHLKTCFGGSLEALYHKASKLALTGRQADVIPLMRAAGATEKDKAATQWINLIVEKSLPISCTRDPTFRKFSKYSEYPMTEQLLKPVLFKLKQLVELYVR